MYSGLPNLGVIEYKYLQIFQNTDQFKEVQKSKECFKLDYKYYMFPQIWGSTSLGFDGEVGGCAMTTAYTTVVHEVHTDTYAVFFSERFAYFVYDATDIFLEDLKNGYLKSVKESKVY